MGYIGMCHCEDLGIFKQFSSMGQGTMYKKTDQLGEGKPVIDTKKKEIGKS